jgi:hypothetical protein
MLQVIRDGLIFALFAIVTGYTGDSIPTGKVSDWQLPTNSRTTTTTTNNNNQNRWLNSQSHGTSGAPGFPAGNH